MQGNIKAKFFGSVIRQNVLQKYSTLRRFYPLYRADRKVITDRNQSRWVTEDTY